MTVETLDFGSDSFLLLCRRLLGGSPARLIEAPRERAVEQAEQHRWQTSTALVSVKSFVGTTSQPDSLLAWLIVPSRHIGFRC